MTGKSLSRKEERKLAAQFLYSLEYESCENVALLEERFREHIEKSNGNRVYNPEAFSWQLALGVWAKQELIDSHITAVARNWKLNRIGKIELVALRIALYEVLYCPDMPKSVIVKEALAIIQSFGDTKASSFITGIIEQVIKDTPNNLDVH